MVREKGVWPSFSSSFKAASPLTDIKGEAAAPGAESAYTRSSRGVLHSPSMGSSAVMVVRPPS